MISMNVASEYKIPNPRSFAGSQALCNHFMVGFSYTNLAKYIQAGSYTLKLLISAPEDVAVLVVFCPIPFK